MKKFLAIFCCMIVFCSSVALADVSIEVPSIMDALVRHRVLLYEIGDTFQEYIVVFFTDSSGVIMQLNDETHFDKSAGYTMDYLRSVDISQYYPGFYDMDFADCLIEDEGTYYSMVVRFKDLDGLGKLDTMKKNCILPNDSYAFAANYIIEGLVSKGMKELNMTEYGGLGLNFQVG